MNSGSSRDESKGKAERRKKTFDLLNAKEIREKGVNRCDRERSRGEIFRINGSFYEKPLDIGKIGGTFVKHLEPLETVITSCERRSKSKSLTTTMTQGRINPALSNMNESQSLSVAAKRSHCSPNAKKSFEIRLLKVSSQQPPLPINLQLKFQAKLINSPAEWDNHPIRQTREASTSLET